MVRVHPEQRQVFAQLGGSPHERAHPSALVEEALQNVNAEESGCSREQD
jgi:hypothetical protein